MSTGLSRTARLTGVSVMAIIYAFASFEASAQVAPVSTTGASPSPTVSNGAGNTGNARPTSNDEIVVTGSRIARPRDEVAPSPIATIAAATLKSTGQNTIGEALNELPQLNANATGSSSSAGGAGGNAVNAGRTLADLRGLGSARTLVLIDGSRVEPSDSFNRVDLSVVPTALVENAEIITGGASAIYGSDALAGVINLKLKQHFTGAQFDAQYGGTTDGGGQNYMTSAIFGQDLGGGRGNLVFAFEHDQRDEIHTRDRPNAYKNSYIFFGTTTGQVYPLAPNAPSQAAINQVFAKYGIAPGTVSPTSSFGFNPDGSVFAEGPGGAGANMQPNVLDNFALDSGGTITSNISSSTAVDSPLSKYNGFMRGHYKFNDNVTFYTQGFYSTYNTKTYGRAVPIVFIPVTNPFIPSDLATLLASRPNPDDPVLYNSVSAQTPIVTTDTARVWQITGGFRGKIGIRDWTYDASGSVGDSTTDERIAGLPNAALLNAAINAPDGGASFCQGGVNLTPVTLSPDCQSKLLQSGYSRTKVYQRSADLSIQGGLAHLPGGELRFAAGFDYRINGYSFAPDAYLQPDPVTGASEFNAYDFASESPSRGSNSVKEGFLELSVPILSHRPLAEELSLDLAYRYADYKIGGSANSYTADAVWAPFRFLRFRGGYQHAIRAPSPGEAYSASVAGTSDIGSTETGGGDPCSVNFQGSIADRSALRQLCIATGVPAGLADSYTTEATGVTTHTSGNPKLKPEIGNSFTAGMVLTAPVRSPWLEGLSVSLDYYNIKVTGAIGSATGQYVVDQCYNVTGDNPNYSADNPYCQDIVRPGAGQPGAYNYINTPLENLGAYKVAGLDLGFNWAINLGEFTRKDIGRIALNSIVSYLATYSIKNASDAPALDYAGTIGNNQISGFSHPRWKANTTLTYTLGNVQVGARWRYIAEMENALNVNSSVVSPGVPAYSYFDLFASYSPKKGLNFMAGMNNLTNKQPPYYTTTSPYTDSSTYDVIGRAFYVRGSVKF
jgi:iron complex outermembrane recepter protein